MKNMSITKITSEAKVLELAEGCENCGNCCKYGAGFVLPKEVTKIAKHFKMSTKEFMIKYLDPVTMFCTTHYRPKLRKAEGKNYGSCVFYDEKRKCTIHSIKPLHCKIGACHKHGEELNEWFIVNHFVDADNPNSVREWAARLKTHPTIPGGEVKDLVQNKEQLKKIKNYYDLKR